MTRLSGVMATDDPISKVASAGRLVEDVRSERTGSLPVEIESLTADMARGDEAAYRRFYDAYFNRLLRYLLVVTSGDETAARDALQMTLSRVVRYIKVFRTEEAFWGWLTKLARSALTDEKRKQRRYFGLLERFLQRSVPLASAPDEPEADELLLSLLEKHLGSLDAQDRVLVERKYFARETVRTIAQSLGLSEKAVDARLVRVRRKLKDFILTHLQHETQK